MKKTNNMKKLFLLALLIAVFSKAAIAQLPTTPIDEADKAILMNIYNSAGGAGWTNKTNWGTSNYPWYGVTVNGSTGKVEHLFLYNNNLVGTLPAINGLTALAQFSCAQNQLSGAIPSLSGLTNLSSFECYSNQFTGEIPSLSGLNLLWSFACSNNKLTGSIPSLSSFTNLSTFYCAGNQLTGTIPSISGMTSLVNFDCGGNKLTGSIPSLSGLTSLTTFGCSNNQLTGTVPSLSGLTALITFSSTDNQLTGTIPSLSGLTNLQYFSISNNQLTGTIPSLSGLTNLKSFYCFSNQLTGTIPSLSGLTALEIFNCSSNQLTGVSNFEKPASLVRYEIHTNNINYSVLDGLSSGLQTSIKTQEFFLYSPQNVPVTLNQADGIVSSNREEGGIIGKITYNWYKQTGATQDRSKDNLIATKSGFNSYKLSAGVTTGDKVYAVISHADWMQQDIPYKNLYFTTNTITVLQPLPVTFGAFEATLKDGQLIVNWQTLTENNCAYYEVQVSNDGNNWHTIQTIQSKAPNGNSSTALHYEYSTPISKIALGLSILAFFTFGFFKQNTSPGNSTNTLAKKSIKIAGFLAIIALVVSCSISCNKKDSANIAVTKEKVFVRIVQVDKDGTRVIGKVIQAVKE